MNATAIFRRMAEAGASVINHQSNAFPTGEQDQFQRRWTINGDFLRFRPNGVARHARETVLALDRLVEEQHPLTQGLSLQLVSPCEPDQDFRLNAISQKVVPEYSRPRLPQFWVQAQLPFHVEGGLLSFCNLAPVAVARQIVCIHDVHTYIMPESYGRGFRWTHRLVLPILGRRTRRVVTVSRYSRESIVDYGVARMDKLSVVYNGCDHVRRWNAEASRLRFGNRPFVLCLGQPQAYKNLPLVLSLLPELQELGFDLALAGDIGENYIREHLGEVPKNLVLLGRVSDDDLAKAYRQAFCFLFPSRIEGFGLPALEAMMHGCPVIASRAAAIPEICENAVVYGGVDSPAEWIAALRMLIQQPKTRARLSEDARRQASRYTWRGVAERYLHLMAAVDAADYRLLDRNAC